MACPKPGLRKPIVGLALGLACMATAALAQSPVGTGGATATGGVQVEILVPLSMARTSDMSFGQIAASNRAGTVTVDGATQRCSATAGVREFGTCRSARFTGMGSRNANARIVISPTTSLTGPGATMTLTGVFLHDDTSISVTRHTDTGDQSFGIASATGTYTLNLGGTLHVNADQAPGVYTGTIMVTVQYQ
jgi:spore coat protein U-like protein